MYWLLNALPMFLEIGILYFRYFGNMSSNSSIDIIWIFVVVPVYLLTVNFHYINAHKASYIKAIIVMLAIFVIRVGYIIFFYWLQFGEFIGDVPVDIYYLCIKIPSITVLIGLGVHYVVKLVYKIIK